MIFIYVTHFFIDSVYYRETKQNGRTEQISIEKDHQLELEFPPILYGSDKLQRKELNIIISV